MTALLVCGVTGHDTAVGRAATALANGFGVVTQNHSEFSRVPGLTVETF